MNNWRINKSGANYFNEYTNGSSNDDSLNSGNQFSHVIKNIQNLNINNSNHYDLYHKDRLNGILNKDLIVKGLDTLSKDSGVQSNGDVDSG